MSTELSDAELRSRIRGYLKAHLGSHILRGQIQASDIRALEPLSKALLELMKLVEEQGDRLAARNATLLSIRERVLAEPTQTGLCNDILSMIGIKDGPETVSGPLWEILYIMRDALNGKPNITYYLGLRDAYFKLKAHLGISLKP